MSFASARCEPEHNPGGGKRQQFGGKSAKWDACALNPLQHDVGEDRPYRIDNEALGEQNCLDLARRNHVAQQRHDHGWPGDRNNCSEESGCRPRHVHNPMSECSGTNAGHRYADSQQVPNRGTHLHQTLRVE